MLDRILIKNSQGDFVDFKPLKPENVPIDSNEVIRPLPDQKGSGYFSSFSICEGLGLGICRCKFNEDYMARFTLKNTFFSLVFCIKGQNLAWDLSQPKSIPETSAWSYAVFFKGNDAERKIKGRQEVLSLAIHVSPEFLIKKFAPVHPRTEQSDNTLEKAFNSSHFYKDHIMTSQMKTTIYQILNNTYKGRVGNLYLESKALELIALRLAQVLPPGRSPHGLPPMDSESRERILQARDMLIKKLSFPPSLRELAEQVGMSHTKLNKGFRMVFGCTVFGYLRKERLSYARMLIEENPVDLTWIAYESGFCSSSHFAAAFLKEYGVRPSEYRKSF
jgi:AraC-like DNA-binding protein